MSEFFLCEIENIAKSGVEIKVTGTRFKKDDDDDCIRTVRTVCFDFSEHDKVFEDKISEQRNEISMLKSLIDNYRDAESKLFEENKESKQHIADLESKETEKPTKINLNDRIKVKLTPLGAEIYYHQYDDIHKDYPKMKKHLQSSLPKVDENGYTEFQLWHFMELYGKHIGMCRPNVISPLDIVVSE